VSTVSVHFADTAATAVGPVGWYLTRAGFDWGGIGVAACWNGGAQGLATTLRNEVSARGHGAILGQMHVGAVDSALHGARTALADAATQVDSGMAHGREGAVLALRVRSIVADAVEVTLRHVAHALGPAPLGFDPEHSRRVADLGLYVRQHHAERDLAALGARLLGAGS
jgi:hypothetical protein